MARKQIGLALDPELLDRVDEARGLVSRAAWIAAACEEKLAPLLMVSKDGGTPVPVRHVHRSAVEALGPVVVDDPDYFAETPTVTAVEEASGGATAPSGRSAPVATSGSAAAPPTPATPRPSIDELREKGLVRPAATFSPKANVKPIPKGE